MPNFSLPYEEYLDYLPDDYVDEIEYLVCRALDNRLAGKDVILYVQQQMKANKNDILKVWSKVNEIFGGPNYDPHMEFLFQNIAVRLN